jgi:two-component system response regulator YesN
MPEALRAVTALYDAAANMPGARGRDYLSLTREAGAIGLGLIGSAERERELSRYRGRLDDASSVRGLFDCLNAFIAEGLRVKTERVRNRDAQPIRLAKQYIHKHFSDPVTLEEVSDAIGFSASYFSALFKKETGEGFSKYLTRVRMEEAKALLRDTRHPVSQICVSVGYADIKHFKHSFKSVTGLTPGEFRKLYG